MSSSFVLEDMIKVGRARGRMARIHRVTNMLSTELSPFLIGFLALVALFACYVTYFVIKLANYCKLAVHFVENQNKNAVSLRRMAEVEATLTDLTDSYDALLAQHKKLRSRIGMRKVREDAGKKPATGLNSTDKDEVRLAAKAANLL